MVKISLKKESRVKKQKQKQKQTQKVVVNIGTNVLKSRRKRTSGPIEKKVVNKQQLAPSTVYVPQAMPIMMQPQQQPSMNEFVKYLKQAELHKEAIKEKEERKSNELEKNKKEEKRSEVLTKDEVQDNFSGVYPSSNISSLTSGTFTSGRLTPETISSLTSGTSTPLLSRPVDHNLLFEQLRREADLRSENPNSGRISFATINSNGSSSLSSELSNSSTTSLLSNPSSKQSLNDLLRNAQEENVGDMTTRYHAIIPTEFKEEVKPVIEVTKPSEYELPDPQVLEEEILLEQEELPQVEPPENIVANEDPVIEQALEEMPENQLVVYGPQRVGETSTATEQTNKPNPIDGTIPAFLRPMNNPLPPVHLKDIVGPLSKAQAEQARQARISKFDNKKEPLMIEEEVLPKFTKEELDSYKKYFQQVEPVVEEENNKSSNQGDSPELIALKSKLKDRNFKRKDMVNLLSKNGITKKDGLKYHIGDGYVNLGSKWTTKTALTEHILTEFNAGRITKL